MPSTGKAAAGLRRAIPYLALLCGAAYLYGAAGQFAQVARPGELGPDVWPRAILALLIVVCAGAILRSLLVAGATAGEARSAAVADEATAAHTDDAPDVAGDRGAASAYRLLAGIGLSAAYVAALEWLGFFVATALYLSLFMVLGRYRRAGVIASVSVLGSLLFVFVFMKVVYVSLPLGAGPFQALSIAILAALGVR
jgi:putative tricarboxylic transport membrane protein